MASTIVAAVLETTGYVTQSNLLDAFSGFWGAVGTFFYTFSCIGAIMSVMIFGSYRYARYLAIGPTLFWFLIGNRVDVPPTQWKLGGGRTTSVEAGFTKTAMEGYDPVAHPPKVPWFFAYYTKAIDDVMTGFVNVILSHENDQDLLFQTRNHMLDFLLNVGPNEDEVYRLFGEGLFNECSPMSNYATALSNKRYSALHNKELVAWQAMGFAEAPAEIAQIEKEKTVLQDAYARASERTMQAGPVTRDFLRRQVMKQISGDAVDNGSHPVTRRFYNDELTPGKTAQEFLDQELGGLTLSCGQMWSITEHAIIEHSKEIIEKANVMHLKGQLADTPENRDMMCRELAMKLSRDWNRFEGGGSNCDLVEVVSVNMFKTALSRMPLSEKIKQKKDRMALVGRTNDMMALDNLGNKDHSSRLITPKDGKAMQVKLNDLGQTVVRDLNAEARNGDGQEVWRPFVSIDLESFSDTAFGHQQRTMSRNLMQGIYSYAMNLPYYQGMLLYLLSMAYPFMCILVIIPSRAMSFLLCPLMWLWVKSWDVGFAIVIILDKVLWNLLPSSDVPYQPLSGDTADMTGVVAAAAGEATRLPEILNSALSVDPSYNILAHFNFVSIALMSVPAFTGFAILKARKSILSSFTDGPKQIAQEAGDMAFSAHNTNISNIQRDKLHRFAGAALQASSDWGEGLFGGGRMQSFLGYGAKKFAANASPKNGGDIVNQFIPRRSSEAIKAELEGVKKSVESATGRTKAILERRVEKLGGELKNAERKDDFLPKDKKAKDGKVDWKKVKRDALYNAWEAMEKGASTGFEIVMAEQAAAARKSWALDDDLGFFGYYSNRMRGVIAGTDGTGGFELEDIDVGGTVAQSQFDLTWRMIDTGYEITGDVIKTVFSNQLENLDDPFIKKMVYNASAGEAALTVNSVEQAFGGASDVHNFIDESKMEYRRRSDENYKKQWEDFFGTDYEKMREQRLEEQEEERKKERHFEEERSKPAKKK